MFDWIIAIAFIFGLFLLLGAALGSTSLSGVQCTARIGWDYQNIIAGLTNPSDQPNNFAFSPTQFTNGTAAGQCDRIYVNSGSIVASGNFTITLTNFSDFFGNTVSMLRFKVLFVMNTSLTSTTTMAMGNATNPLANWISATTTTLQIRPGGAHLSYAVDATGWPIVAGTSDTLKLLNNDGANPCTYNLVIMGCSA